MTQSEPCLRLTIDGRRISGVSSFYAEINRVFMSNESWRLGESLDALNDLLHAGYGALAGAQRVVVQWTAFEHCRAALGAAETLRLLTARRAIRTHFNGQPIDAQIAALERGEGTTYFDIVLGVFADHPAIRLEPA